MCFDFFQIDFEIMSQNGEDADMDQEDGASLPPTPPPAPDHPPHVDCWLVNTILFNIFVLFVQRS